MELRYEGSLSPYRTYNISRMTRRYKNAEASIL
jgi:hypothetical protein